MGPADGVRATRRADSQRLEALAQQLRLLGQRPDERCQQGKVVRLHTKEHLGVVVGRGLVASIAHVAHVLHQLERGEQGRKLLEDSDHLRARAWVKGEGVGQG